MPEARETTVCFRLWSDDLVPSEVTERLGITPSLAYAKGEVWQVSKRTGRQYVARTGTWHLKTALPENATLDEHYRSLLQQLLPVASHIRVYVDSGCTAD